MNSALESLQAIGLDIWLPYTPPKPIVYEFSINEALQQRATLILASAEDQQNWQNLTELFAGIMRWLKLSPDTYNLAFLSPDQSGSIPLHHLIDESQAVQILSFGVPLRLALDSELRIRYFETLALSRVINNVENKRQVMNDFAGFSI
ncbi:MAG: hypothetical protein Q7V63_05645 [Gammaproteobacteria bacterium]|nr:hypothetical protein [Gammaproteobacteria bacterium]